MVDIGKDILEFEEQLRQSLKGWWVTTGPSTIIIGDSVITIDHEHDGIPRQVK